MKRLLIIFFLQIFVVSTAQNLVPNPSFEANKGCPEEDKQIELVRDWWSPLGFPFYFHECNGYKTPYRRNVPPNEKKYNTKLVQANTGKAYVGIYLASISNEKMPHDYIMTELKDSLEKNQMYEVSMFVRLADVWKYADNIGVYFSKEKYKVSKRQLIKLSPTYQYYCNRASLTFKQNTCILRHKGAKLNSRDKWVKVEGLYRAKGGERYLTIGNFHLGWRGIASNNIAPDIIREHFDYSHYYYTFYYIDDVFVQKQDSVSALEVFEKNVKLGEPMIMEHIYFNSGKATIKENSFPMLNTIVDYLEKNTSYSIKIAGHTDNIGDKDFNLTLSKERAKSVATYLIKKGINRVRIKTEGLGCSKPIAKNDTKANRKRNRRVEFIIYKK